MPVVRESMRRDNSGMKKLIPLRERVGVSQTEAAALIGVSRNTLAAAILSGDLALHRIPNSCKGRIVVTELETWVASLSRPPRRRRRSGSDEVLASQAAQ